MANILFNTTMTGIQGMIWLLRRFDYYVEKSVVDLGPVDSDPHQVADTLRQRATILRSHANRGWIISGHAEVTELLRDERASSAIGNSKFVRRLFRLATGESHLPFLENPSMQQVDPPDHSRLRKLVARGFVQKYIQTLVPIIESLVDEILAPLDANQSFDLIDVMARPLPALVIAEMMGVPVEDRYRFEQWSSRLLGIADIGTPEKIGDGLFADIEMREYMADLVEAKRARSGQDFISMLISAEEEGDKLSLDELLSTCVLLLVAGHETTTRLLGSTVLLLLQNPEQLVKARSDEKCLENAIEEGLRLEPPVMFVPRVVASTFDYQGYRFKKGQLLLLSLSAANRDPQVIRDPHRFDVDRQDTAHISFGHGIHLCLGMTLARIESKIVLSKVFEKFPNLTLADATPHWQQTPMFRGLESLQLATR